MYSLHLSGFKEKGCINAWLAANLPWPEVEFHLKLIGSCEYKQDLVSTGQCILSSLKVQRSVEDHEKMRKCFIRLLFTRLSHGPLRSIGFVWFHLESLSHHDRELLGLSWERAAERCLTSQSQSTSTQTNLFATRSRTVFFHHSAQLETQTKICRSAGVRGDIRESLLLSISGTKGIFFFFLVPLSEIMFLVGSIPAERVWKHCAPPGIWVAQDRQRRWRR